MDKSNSMKTKDCLAARLGYPRWNPAQDGLTGKPLELLSRWDWCQREILGLAGQTARLPHKAVTLVLFSGDFDVYKDADLDKVPRIFARYRLGRGTYVARALESQLRDYFRDRDNHESEVKPLVIAVITDGVPDDPEEVKSVIVDATSKMRNRDEISLTFLQVGTDPRGQMFLRTLDNALMSQGARFDIVQTRKFAELLEKGLTYSLLDAIGGGGDNHDSP